MSHKLNAISYDIEIKLRCSISKILDFFHFTTIKFFKLKLYFVVFYFLFYFLQSITFSHSVSGELRVRRKYLIDFVDKDGNRPAAKDGKEIMIKFK